MNNPFQDQLLKAGLVSKQQVQKANTDKNKKKKQQRNQKNKVVDEAAIKAKQIADAKTQRDRELNQRKQVQAKAKALSAEINQLILDNLVKRDEACEIVYNFEHDKKVKRIHVNAEMKQQIIKGKLGLARIDGRYELVPALVAEKIKQRNERRVVIFTEVEEAKDENDPYADFEIPDDLTW